MNERHQLLLSLARVIDDVGIWRTDIGESNLFLVITTTHPIDFATTKRTISIKEHANGPFIHGLAAKEFVDIWVHGDAYDEAKTFKTVIISYPHPEVAG